MIRQRIFDIIDVNRPGLEIGALDRPIVSRAMGPVGYVDRASRDEILSYYGPHDNVDKAAIVDVDHVWGEQTLLECVGGQARFHYILSSHVIEHVPDLIGWLMEVGSVLEDGGLAVFIVPDKRYTFDLLRRTSGPAEMVDAYVRGLRRPDARQLFDHLYNIRDAGDPGAGGPTDEQTRHLIAFCQAANAAPHYHDVHCWVFTPRALLDAFDLASRLDLLPFEIERLEPTEPGAHEFLAVLRRLPADLDLEARRAAFVASRERVVLPEETTVADPHAATRAEAACAQLAAIQASTSWRITAPLRAAVTTLRGLLGRA